MPQPTERHREVLGGLLAGGPVQADLAALAVERGLILRSTDGDFARLPALRRENPLP